MLFNEIDNFIEVYNNSVIFGTSCFGRIHLASSVIKFRPKNSVPKNTVFVQSPIIIWLCLIDVFTYIDDHEYPNRINKDLTVKIADFGLSRDIYNTDYYKMDDIRKPLPVKWMSLESLQQGIYTTKTDVVGIFNSACIDIINIIVLLYLYMYNTAYY